MVEVRAYRNILGARGREGIRQNGGGPVAQRGSDAGCMEPVRALENPRPGDGSRLDARERRTGAVVHDAHEAQIGAGLDEVDPQSVAATENPLGAHPLALEGGHGRIADRIIRHAGDVVAADAEMTQRDGDIRFRPTEERHEPARYEQALVCGRAQSQQELAERDCSHPRASFTRVTNARARAVRSAARSGPSMSGLTSAPPTLTAAAPPRIQSPAFSSETPPEGTSRRKGRGASRSRTKPGASAPAGNTFTSGAPARQALKISVGENAPGIHGTSRSRHVSSTARCSTGLTTKRAPASIT